VAGLAISFGAHKLVRDILSGIFLLMEDEYRVGETVTLAGVPGMSQLSGRVVELGLRVTRLEDGVGRRVTVCNGDVAAVMNHSRGLLLTAVELGVPAETSQAELQAALAAADLPGDLFAGPAEAAGVVSTDGTRQVVRITARSRPDNTGETELVLRRAAAEALQKAGIGLR
jgi:small conductance mechanosensitive channel